MSATAAKSCGAPAAYHRRQPERTVLYRIVQAHLATWLALHDDGCGGHAPVVTEREFRRYLECGILAHGFARARCAGVFCGEDAGDLHFQETRLTDEQMAQLQRTIRQRIVRLFVRRGLLDKAEGQAMNTCEHDGGFSLDSSVRIEANDRKGLERLLRYCARPAFAQERLRQLDPEHLVYESKKPGPGGKVSVLLTPHQLLDRLSALIPPPRRHRHRYYGVLAPNSPWRSVVTALEAAPESPELATDEGKGKAKACAETEETPVRQAARFLWAMLLARIYEVFPLICPICGGTMKIIAFIDEGDAIREILSHLGEPVDPPRIAPARDPPLWEAAGQCADDLLIDPPPEYEFDQRIAW